MTSFFNCNHDWKEKQAHDLKGPKRYIFAKNGPFWPKILHNVYQIFESPASILCIMEISFMFYLFLFFFQWMHIIQVQHSLYTKASRRRIANQKNKKQKKIKKIKKNNLSYTSNQTYLVIFQMGLRDCSSSNFSYIY